MFLFDEGEACESDGFEPCENGEGFGEELVGFCEVMEVGGGGDGSVVGG